MNRQETNYGLVLEVNFPQITGQVPAPQLKVSIPIQKNHMSQFHQNLKDSLKMCQVYLWEMQYTASKDDINTAIQLTKQFTDLSLLLLDGSEDFNTFFKQSCQTPSLTSLC